MATKKRPSHRDQRPEGSNWYGIPTNKATIRRAARRCLNPNGTINSECFANEMMRWGPKYARHGNAGGWTEVRRIHLGEPGSPKK